MQPRRVARELALLGVNQLPATAAKLSEKQLEDLLLAAIRALQELPSVKRRRYQQVYGLSVYDSRYLSDERNTAEYFEAVVAAGADPKAAANWMMSDIASYLNTHKLDYPDIALKPETLAELIGLIEQGTISSKIAKEILPELLEKGGSARALVEAKGLTQISDSSLLEPMIAEVLAENPEQLQQYREGKTKLFGYFVGQLMKKTQGRADPKLANELLKRHLDG